MGFMREFRLRGKRACGGERFCLLTNNLRAMKRANAYYDLAKWDIKFPVSSRETKVSLSLSLAAEYYAITLLLPFYVRIY